MSICYVLAQLPQVSETFILGEIEELVRQGEDVRVLSLAPLPPAGGVASGSRTLLSRTTAVPGGATGGLRLLMAVVRSLARHPVRTGGALRVAARGSLHRRSRAELVHLCQACYLRTRLPADPERLHAQYAHAPATTAMLLARLSRTPFSFTAHARDMFELSDPWTLRRNAAAAADVVAISEHGRSYLRGVLGPLAGKVTVIRNGLDLTTFAPRRSTPRGVPVVLAVSRLVDKKGLDTLVDACAILVGRGHRLRCEVVGDGPLRPQLAGQVDRVGLTGTVRLLGSRDTTEVVAAYRRATVVALPCRRDRAGDQDGLPVSLVEAMAVGVPVVSTPTAGVPEVVRDEVSGLLVEPDDPQQLATAIERLLVDQQLRHRLSAAGRQVAAGYDRSVWVGRLRTLLHGGGGPPDDGRRISDEPVPLYRAMDEHPTAGATGAGQVPADRAAT